MQYLNLELVKSLGADKVIDYTKEDFTQNGEIYDAIFDAVDEYPSAQAKTSLKEKGVYLNVDKDSEDIKDSSGRYDLPERGYRSREAKNGY